MLVPTTCVDTFNVTGSPASAGGPSRSDWPVGMTRDLFGLDPALARDSASPAPVPGGLTIDISGRTGIGSSASRALQSSLENKLMRRFVTAGSTLFALTWKHSATPAGRPYCQLRASARSTNDHACGSWPTAAARDYRHANAKSYRERSQSAKGEQLANAVQLATWPTTTTSDARSAARHGYMVNGQPGTALLDAARLAAWPTPMAGTPAQKGYNEAGKNDYSRKVVDLTHGPTATGSHVETANRGQLNPAFSLWLMGYEPVAWLLAAPSTKPASRSRPKRGRTNSVASAR